MYFKKEKEQSIDVFSLSHQREFSCMLNLIRVRIQVLKMEVFQRKLTTEVSASGDAVSHPENSLNQSTIPDQNPISPEIFLWNLGKLLEGQRRFYFCKYMCVAHTHIYTHTADGLMSLTPVCSGVFYDNQCTHLPQNMISMTYCDSLCH